MKKERIGNYYFLSDQKKGVSGIFSHIDFLILTFFDDPTSKEEEIIHFLNRWGFDISDAIIKYHDFIRKITAEGWLRGEVSYSLPQPLKSLYFTVTTNCNLECPYCYLGLQREKCFISIENVKLAIERLKKTNSNCQLIITGGEPFLHPEIFEIIDLIESDGFSFAILTNGTLIDEIKARKLASYKFLKSIQVSLDGISLETHKKTRGNSFIKTMRGIKNISKNKIPFSIAPTIHEDNANEIKDIAKLALENGGWITPNNLIVFPECKKTGLSLSNETLENVIKELDKLFLSNSEAFVLNNKKEYNYPVCGNLFEKDSKTLCDIAYALFDLNWNGDVFPCNLLRKDEFILGNLFREDWDLILKRGAEFRMKLHCQNIEKCKTCDIINLCSGGCRASALNKYGTFQKEDPLCNLRYRNIKGQIIEECKNRSNKINRNMRSLQDQKELDNPFQLVPPLSD